MKKIIVLMTLSCLLLLAVLPQRAYAAKSKFQIEFYGGYASINPYDLNLLPQRDRWIRDYYYPRHLEALLIDDIIEEWSDWRSGEYKEIKSGFPFGLRLKYYLNPTLAVSLGFRTLSRTQESAPSYQYAWSDSRNYTSHDEKWDYPQYTLSAKGTAALLGIHLKTPSRGRFSLEGHVSAGPLFARCNYVRHWHSESIHYEGLTFAPVPPEHENYNLTLEGNGTGIAADAGIRLNVALGRSFGVFLGAGYAYQSVKNISGKGWEDDNGQVTQWDGQWKIKVRTIETAWGTEVYRYPTNYWPEDETAGAEDFKLDLSGFQLQVGLYFRF